MQVRARAPAALLAVLCVSFAVRTTGFVASLLSAPSLRTARPVRAPLAGAPAMLLSPGDLSAAALLLGDAAQAAAGALPQAPSKVAFEPRGITTQDSVVFVIGVIPFVWATYEFWRRIAVGEPFGTTKDGSVVIAPEPDKVTGQPRRLLGPPQVKRAARGTVGNISEFCTRQAPSSGTRSTHLAGSELEKFSRLK